VTSRPGNVAEVERLRKLYEDELEAILQDGVDAGLFRLDDTKVTPLAIIAMLTGISIRYQADGRLSLNRIETLYVGMVRRLVGL